MKISTALGLCLTIQASSFLVSAMDQDEPSVAHPDTGRQLKRRLKNVDKINYDDRLTTGYHTESRLSGWQPDNTEPSLRQVLFIHRHGDRTPLKFSPGDPIKDEPFWAFHGLGQLTNRGKARLYQLGKIIRKRYNNFLGGSVNKNQRISRSSGSLRCIESGQSFLAAFLALDQAGSVDAKNLIWDHNSNAQLAQLWQPASIQSVPVVLDGMLAEGAKCKVLSEEYLKIDASQLGQEINTEFSEEARVIKSAIGFEVDRFFKWLWIDSTLEIEKSYFKDKMLPEILRVYDRTEKASNLAAIAYQSTVTSKRLRSGLLINDMIGNMRNFRDLKQQGTSDDSDKLKKFVHYVAHDLTLVVLLGMLDSFETTPHRPDYAANIAIELHQDADEWFVKIYYMPEVPSLPMEVHIERCERGHGKRCTLDKLTELMQPYMIDSWINWMEECNNDIKILNPYAPGS